MSSILKKLHLPFAIAAIAVASISSSSADNLAAWEFTGLTGYGASPLTTGTAGSNVTIVGPTRGSGLATTGTAASNAWGSVGWEGTASAAAAVTANKFATFSVTATSGHSVSFSSIEPYNIRRSGGGPTTGQWQYSVGGGAFTDIGTPITWGTITAAAGNPQAAINLTGIPALQNVVAGSVVVFRVANYGASAGGTWYLNNLATAGADLIVTGTTTTVGATPLTLAISPSTFSESAGVQTNIATLSIPSNAVGDQTFNVVSNDTTEATVPSTVTILNGTSSISFSITPINDLLADGNQTFNIVASAAGYLDGVQSITVNDDGDLPMTVSVTPATFGEDAAVISNGGTVTLPAAALADTVITLASSDTSEVTVPSSVTVLSGNTTATFDVTPVNDNVVDGTQNVTITASSADYTSGTFSVAVTDDGDLPPPIVISQYYEGLSNDKYIELYNTSASPVTLTNYRLTIWTNADAEKWKNNSGSPNNTLNLSSITIPGNSYWLFKNTTSANPAYANNTANTASTVIGGFNGNDSIVLYLGATNDVSNIVDAFSLTNGGNEGQDKSFYRIANNVVGYSLTTGDSVLTATGAWASKTLADVASALPADAWYLTAYVEPQAPALDAFVVGNSASSTPSPIVTVNYASSLGIPLEYRVSETADLSDAAWTPLATYLTYTLSAGTGTKTVYFQLRNATGVSSIASDTIDATAYGYTPEVLITQYYEPDAAGGNSKYIELTNVSATPVDMTSWSLVRWTNQDADHWQHTGAVSTSSPNGAINLSGIGILTPGQTVIIANSSATAPIAAASAQVSNANMSFNGNDSVALYKDTPSPASLVDVVSFTNLGNEGADKSFVRQTGSQGFSFVTGTSVLNFSSVWSSVTLATVDAAVAGQNNYLGTYPGGNTYDTWKTLNANGEAANVDTDGDGIANGAEYFMGTLGNAFNQNPGPVSGVVTWPRAAGTTITSFKVEVSSNLSTWENATVNYLPNLAISGSSVSFTLPTTPGPFFVRLSVTP